MLDLNISTTCAKGHFKKQTFCWVGVWYDHDMLEEDVKIHDLEVLLEDNGIARLVTICVVWFEALCDFKLVIFGISYIYIYFPKLLPWKFLKLHLITNSLCSNFKTYGYNKKIILNYIFQFEKFSKKEYVVLKFLTLSTFCFRNFSKVSTSPFLNNLHGNLIQVFSSPPPSQDFAIFSKKIRKKLNF